ncbi:MAG: hypothetical protein B7Y02_11250 [Rhodobacterales bacterium 17-64-5]|nr:MAG: hypothetical protein B7Y02_11250 [Rhodobacterales bacterium 17-64-5]
MEFFADKDTSFDPKTMLGKRITLETVQGFKFSGIVITVEDIGLVGCSVVFAAELRPWLWLTTLAEENRVFQNMSTVQVIEEVFSKMGISDFTKKATNTYPPREYCVQYGETNFDFISRLMEEDGIYYYFDHSGAVENLVLADSSTTPTDEGEIDFTKGNNVGTGHADINTIYEWTVRGKVVSGKVSLWDYDFTNPTADLKVTSANPSGSHSHNQIERYKSGGHYTKADVGQLTYARNLAEAHAAEADRVTGLCNTVKVRPGVKFKLNHPNRDAVQGVYKVVGTTHYIRFDDAMNDSDINTVARATELIQYPKSMNVFETEFEVMPDAVTFKPHRITPWPEVPSLLTAMVTGPSGEEIYTDTYGRIRIQFPWDRIGKKDDKSSCWVRTVMPWTGKNFGFIAVPRIGMEVIIQFERGNIDRPICTGMVYDGAHMAPENLANTPANTVPAAMDTLTLRTNSTKGGGGFHELSMKDEKGKEKVFFQSEKDYEQKIKNNAVITIGMEKKDKGDLTQTIYHNKTETIKMGNLTQTVETGSRITKIKTNDTTTVTGASTTKITGDTSLEIQKGDFSEKVSEGDMSTEVSKGDMSVLLPDGDISVKATAGKIEIEAGTSITLKVGGNSITIDTSGIKVNGDAVSITAGGQACMEGAIIKVAASGTTTVQGGFVKINC